jgi:hypothetical protein
MQPVEHFKLKFHIGFLQNYCLICLDVGASESKCIDNSV